MPIGRTILPRKLLNLFSDARPETCWCLCPPFIFDVSSGELFLARGRHPHTHRREPVISPETGVRLQTIEALMADLDRNLSIREVDIRVVAP